jgi:ABC-type transport system involved in multi-copper enzyme maturation permease subunit
MAQDNGTAENGAVNRTAPIGGTSKAPPSAPGLWQCTLRVFDLSLGQMLWSRRTVFMALVVAAPMALALLYRILHASFGDPQVDGLAVKGTTLFGMTIWLLYLRFIVPILGVFYGTALIADEVDDKTITYLFVRPIARRAILLGKYLAYLASTVCVVLPSVMVVYFLTTAIDVRVIAGSFPALAKDLALLGIGLAVYGAVFAFVGTRLKHPLVIGLVFAFGWEQFALFIPGYVRRFTVIYYLQALVPHAMPQDSATSVLQAVFRQVPPALECIAWLAVIWGVFLFLAARTIERREYVLEQ